MIKIYGSPQSSAGRCYWLMEELEIPYERIPLNMSQKEHKSEEFLRLNPNGKVPTMIDGDFILWESAAINAHLARLHRPDLLGRSAKEQAKVDQWTLWAMIDLQPPHVEALIQKVFIPPERRDAGVIEKALKSIGPRLEILERHLKGRQFMVGDGFTLADINVASVVMINSAIQNDISDLKSIGSWMANLSERPGFQKYVRLRG